MLSLGNGDQWNKQVLTGKTNMYGTCSCRQRKCVRKELGRLKELPVTW